MACNADLKFGSLLGRAAAWDAAAVATGHYARVERDAERAGGGSLRARDLRKDQTDFLWPLTQAQLGAARFPIGELTKDEVREHARRLGLVTADKPESQEICFVPDGNYRGFLRQREPGDVPAPAPIVDVDGRAARPSRAAWPDSRSASAAVWGWPPAGRSTSSTSTPQTDRVTVGDAADLERDRLVAGRVNFIAGEPPAGPLRVLAKIRHNHEPAAGHAADAGRRPGRGRLRSSPSARSPRASRACGIEGEVVLGGGVIEPGVDTRPNRVIVFTNLQQQHVTGGIRLMHHRRSDWRGWLMCAVVSLLLVLPAIALAAEGGGEHGGGGLISLDKSLIVQVINFVILLFILQRFLYKPFLAKMEERTAAIKRSLDEAQAARAEAAAAAGGERGAAAGGVRRGGVDSRPGASRGARRPGASSWRRRRPRRASWWRTPRPSSTARSARRATTSVARRPTSRWPWPRSSSAARLREEDHRKIVADAIAGLKTS